MTDLLKMQNTIQPYAWGSHSAIARLMARPYPTETPEAELWMGAHPKAPSAVWVQNQWQPLDTWIAQDPGKRIGEQVQRRFGSTLPYLLKILAADQPLSIQAHPAKSQARRGYEDENLKNIPMDAAHRNYKDPHHKPECICALTSFQAMCGFRRENDILTDFSTLWPRDQKDALAILRNDGLKSFFKHLMTMDRPICATLVERILQKISSQTHQTPAHRWMVQLQSHYPGDVGVLSPLLLNLIQLQPGEAVALNSGQLHAYLDGVGIEIMANSDNVLRGGLTPKHVDVPELLKVLDFNPSQPEILKACPIRGLEKAYTSHAEEFTLSVIESSDQSIHRASKRAPYPEILLCIQGTARLAWPGGRKEMVLDPGHSAFVPASLDQYAITGEAIVYKATVNIEE